MRVPHPAERLTRHGAARTPAGHPATQCCAGCGGPLTVHEAARDQVCARPECRRRVLAAAMRAQIEAERAIEAAIAARARRRYEEALAARAPDGLAAPAFARVPHLDRPLEPASRRRHRDFLRTVVKRLREALTLSDPAGGEWPDAGIDPALVAAGCSACRGHCCRNGGEHAYLDAPALRDRLRSLGLRPAALLARYRRHLPHESVHASCVFHGAGGCALPRALRSPVCNAYHCSALHALPATVAAAGVRGVLLVAMDVCGEGVVRALPGAPAAAESPGASAPD